jgi:outer membrane protein TolC
MSVEKQQQRNQLRAQVFQLYYNLVKLNEEKLKIEKLQATTDKILESYQLRKNENPVGYSGYLGLKALKEQLDSQLTSMQQQKKLIYSSIAELISTTTTTTSIESGNESTRNSVKNSMKLSALPDQWQPENKSVEQIRQQLEKYISNASKVSADAQTQGQQSDSSIKSKIANTPEYQMAVVQKNMADKNKLVQTSYWKPELGAFGETYLMNGSRGTATGNTVGVYLRWGFSGQLVGNVDQAKKEALAAQYYADAIEQKITVQTLSQMEGNQVIETQIKSTEQTLALLEEQTTMMKKLYQSGAINSLQLVDVFSRHLMLIQQQSQLKTQWINNLSNLIQIYGLESGVNHASK